MRSVMPNMTEEDIIDFEDFLDMYALTMKLTYGLNVERVTKWRDITSSKLYTSTMLETSCSYNICYRYKKSSGSPHVVGLFNITLEDCKIDLTRLYIDSKVAGSVGTDVHINLTFEEAKKLIIDHKDKVEELIYKYNDF